MDSTRSFYSSDHFMDFQIDDSKISLEVESESSISLKDVFDDPTLSKVNILGSELLETVPKSNPEHENFPSILVENTNSMLVDDQTSYEELFDGEITKKDFRKKMDALSTKRTIPNRTVKSRRLYQLSTKTTIWSQDDVRKLIELVQQLGTSSWLKIASLMNYSAKQCKNKWYVLVKNNPSLAVPSTLYKWTSDTETKLIELVRLHGTGSWETIALQMNLKASQCRFKWKKLIKANPSLAVAPSFHRWTKDEEVNFIELVKIHGTSSWKKIASLMNLEVNHCRSKWSLLLKKYPTLANFSHIHQWTKNEEIQLIELVKTYSTAWTKIASEMNLNKNVCRRKWKSLTEIDPSLIPF